MKGLKTACCLLLLGCLALFLCGRAESARLFDDLNNVLKQALALSPETEKQEGDVYTAEYSAFDESAYTQFLSVFLDNGFEISQWRGRGRTVHVTFVSEDAIVTLDCDGDNERAVITCPCALLTQTFHLPVQSGDRVLFGAYEQDNDLANGPEEIEWTVLEDRKSVV